MRAIFARPGDPSMMAGALDIAVVADDGTLAPPRLQIARIDPARATPYASEDRFLEGLLAAMLDLHDDASIAVERKLFVCTARGKAALVKALLDRRQGTLRALPPPARRAPSPSRVLANVATAGALTLVSALSVTGVGGQSMRL